MSKCEYCDREECDGDCDFCDRNSKDNAPRKTAAEWRAIGRTEQMDLLEQMVKHVRKVGGYMVPEDQLALFKAESVLRDAGRQA